MPTQLVYVAPASVEQSELQISVPGDIVDAGIVTPGDYAYWSFEEVTGTLLLSNAEPEMDAYVTLQRMPVERDQHTIAFPAPLQPTPERDVDVFVQESTVHEDALVDPDTRYHFIYRDDGMADGRVRSCYLLSDAEVVDRLSAPHEWGDNFAEVPQFF